MAEEKALSIKVMVDKVKNKVLFANSDQDFVDVLLSFLTLPMGTIVRLLSTSSTTGSRLAVPCMNNLYNSVEKLDVQYFKTRQCKNMLLFPRRASEAKCNRIKVKMDKTEPTKYYVCSRYEGEGFVSYTPCICTKTDDESHNIMYMREDWSGRSICTTVRYPVNDGGVFVKEGNIYMIHDDLQVQWGSVAACMSLVGLEGIQDWSRLEERNIDMGFNEVLLLLKRSLISATPLTDLILSQGESVDAAVKKEKRDKPQYSSMNTGNGTSSTSKKQICVTLVTRKSNSKPLYAVAQSDFVDLLCSFLTFPLGSILKFCSGNSSIGCVDNLYKSVGVLSSQGNINSESCKEALVSPKLNQHFSLEDQPLQIDEVPPQVNGCGILNPKATFLWNKQSGGGFIRGPTTFMVTNDLVVTPCCLTTGLILLKSMNVPIHDVDERIVTVGEQEAFKLLMASMLSDTALDALTVPKQQAIVKLER